MPDEEASASLPTTLKPGYFRFADHGVGRDPPWMAEPGLLTMPDGSRVIEDGVVDRTARECRTRGIYYSADEVAGKAGN